MTLITAVRFAGQLLIVVGFVMAAGYSESRADRDRLPADLPALNAQRRRRMLVRVGVALACIGLLAQLAGGGLVAGGAG